MQHTTRDSERAIAEWLAGALPDPATAYTAWADTKVALLPLGGAFAAVRIDAAVIHAAVSSTDPAIVSGVLGEALDGPVIHDPVSCRYYPLIADPAPTEWEPPAGSALVGQGSYMGVPRLDQTTPRRDTYWSVPPAAPHAVCDLGRVIALILEGQERLGTEAS